MVAPRIVAAAVAVLVCLWFVLGVRQAHDLTRATAIATADSISPARAAQAASLLGDAGTLNPDSEVSLVRVHLLFRTGAGARALALAERITRQEPLNPLAWLELATVSGRDPAVLVNALSHIRALSPTVPPAH